MIVTEETVKETAFYTYFNIAVAVAVYDDYDSNRSSLFDFCILFPYCT